MSEALAMLFLPGLPVQWVEITEVDSKGKPTKVRLEGLIRMVKETGKTANGRPVVRLT